MRLTCPPKVVTAAEDYFDAVMDFEKVSRAKGTAVLKTRNADIPATTQMEWAPLSQLVEATRSRLDRASRNGPRAPAATSNPDTGTTFRKLESLPCNAIRTILAAMSTLVEGFSWIVATAMPGQRSCGKRRRQRRTAPSGGSASAAWTFPPTI